MTEESPDANLEPGGPFVPGLVGPASISFRLAGKTIVYIVSASKAAIIARKHASLESLFSRIASYALGMQSRILDDKPCFMALNRSLTRSRSRAIFAWHRAYRLMDVPREKAELPTASTSIYPIARASLLDAVDRATKKRDWNGVISKRERGSNSDKDGVDGKLNYLETAGLKCRPGDGG